ncbi:MAG: dTDP-4-dehydrorhamnose reductase [Bacteroides sp.]|nr:dTDP-4-dehydrorhamnose reductase [Bacteroides sp.]
MRILVTGGEGQLGHCLRKSVAGSANEYVFTDVDDLDITDPEAVALGIACNDFQLIVNCAAYTNVDRAESQEEIAESINSLAVSYLAKAAKDNDIPIIHISTDYVFGGYAGNHPLTEDMAVCPTSAYGRTKYHGEQMIEASGCRHIIIRTAWLYSEYGHNFVKTMLGLIGSRPELNVVFDQIGSPTYAQDLADAIVNIIDSGKYKGNDGIYHYSNEGVCSWFDFSKMIQEIAFPTDPDGKWKCKINPIHSTEFPSPATRPPFSLLDKTKFRQTFNLDVPYWVDSLRICLLHLTENKQHEQNNPK